MKWQSRQGTGTLINYRFPPPSEFVAGSTSSRLDIGNHTHVALDDNKGELTVELDNVFRLVIAPSSDAPEWSELGIALADSGWLECRRIHLKYRASTQSPAQIRPALRLFSETGFQDIFAPCPNDLDSAPAYCSADFLLPPRLTEQTRHIALQLFFDNNNNALELHNLVLTGFR